LRKIKDIFGKEKIFPQKCKTFVREKKKSFIKYKMFFQKQRDIISRICVLMLLDILVPTLYRFETYDDLAHNRNHLQPFSSAKMHNDNMFLDQEI
jgi:hypothetical protein